MAAKILLAGQNEARGIITPLTRTLRERGHQTSAFFGQDVPFAARQLDSYNLFVLGLTREGRDVSSAPYAWEKNLLKAIRETPRTYSMPGCIISDVDGLVSAHYLGEYGEMFRLVACDERAQVASLELFSDYRTVARDAEMIADSICDLLRTPSPAQQSAGWSNSLLTD